MNEHRLRECAGGEGAGVKKLVAVVVLALTASLFVVADQAAGTSRGAAAPGASEGDVQRWERERQDAFIRGDLDALDRATAADYTTINASGKLSSKPQMMASLRAGKTKVVSVELENLKARVYGDTAVLTGEYRDVNVRDGMQRETHTFFTRVFVRNEGGWQAVAYQQTAVPTQ
jgi:hypothetical protein